MSRNSIILILAIVTIAAVARPPKFKNSHYTNCSFSYTGKCGPLFKSYPTSYPPTAVRGRRSALPQISSFRNQQYTKPPFFKNQQYFRNQQYTKPPSFKNKQYFRNQQYTKPPVRGRRSALKPKKFNYISPTFKYSKFKYPKFSYPTSRPPVRGRRSADASCYLEVVKAGVNVSAFHLDVAHGIHSITAEDIKYYFDSSIPDQMSIPTVNFNLSGQHVLLSPPLGSEFSTPGMRLFDFVLSNDDGKDHFMVQGLSRMEKIAHGMHMLELWHKTSKVYNQIKANPPNEKVCSCLTDEDQNGILAALEDISIYLRKFSGEEEMTSNQIEEDPSSNEVDNDAGRVTENEEEAGALPELKDAESWKIWKAMLNDSMIDEKGIYHLAMYLYCKIATVAQI